MHEVVIALGSNLVRGVCGVPACRSKTDLTNLPLSANLATQIAVSLHRD